jgi:hypothetical protein
MPCLGKYILYFAYKVLRFCRTSGYGAAKCSADCSELLLFGAEYVAVIVPVFYGIFSTLSRSFCSAVADAKVQQKFDSANSLGFFLKCYPIVLRSNLKF